MNTKGLIMLRLDEIKWEAYRTRTQFEKAACRVYGGEFIKDMTMQKILFMAMADENLSEEVKLNLFLLYTKNSSFNVAMIELEYLLRIGVD